MSISLQKGQKVSLSKENAGLSNVLVGLGWDEVKRTGGFLSQPADEKGNKILYHFSQWIFYV